jgi:phage baseplate assembly protein W
MAVIQKYGIKYPFTTNNNDELYLDLNKTYGESIQSQVLHIIFTPKGQKLRDPDFGTNLINYIFNPSDTITFNDIKNEISIQLGKYVPFIEFRDISVYNNEDGDNSIVVIVEYGVKKGNKTEVTKVAVKL